MNCEACGHDWFEHHLPGHGVWNPPVDGLCENCFWDYGECFPWEFR